MSLINDMLKDLERRKNRDQLVSSLAIGNTYEPDASRPYAKMITLLLIGTAIVTSAYLTRTLMTKSPHSLQQIQPNIATVSPPHPTATSNESNWLATTNITGMTLQTKENITELTFMLSHQALYEISTNGMQNQFFITIEKSQLQSEIPPVSFLNTAIQSITATPLNGDTRFNLTLNPNATIKYVNMNADEKNPELVIAVEYLATDAPVKEKTAAIKTPVMQNLLIQKYQLALDAAKLGKQQQAITNLASIIEVDPEYQEARTTLAALLLDKGNYQQATKIVNDGLNISPDYSPLVELKARLLTQSGKVQQALNLLQSAVPPMNENPNYHALIAALYSQNNKDVLAIRTYQKLLAMDPHNGSWWFALGVSYDKLGQSREATTSYERALSEGHLNTDSLAYLQRRLESLQEADNDKA